jgi:hypothetical protein
MGQQPLCPDTPSSGRREQHLFKASQIAKRLAPSGILACSGNPIIGRILDVLAVSISFNHLRNIQYCLAALQGGAASFSISCVQHRATPKKLSSAILRWRRGA